jgi:hypothetical protein
MANKKNQLDDFDFDNLDFDSLDSQSSSKKDKSGGPFRKMSRSFGEGAREAMTDPQVLKRFASSALPDGYGTVINTTSDLADGAAELYNIAAKELAPAMPAMRRAAGRLAKSGSSVLPKKIQDKLNEFAKDPQMAAAMSKEEQDNAAIAQELGGIFAVSMQQQQAQHTQAAVENKIRARVQDKFSMASLQRLDAVRGGIDRLVAYQDQVTLKYQQKSLELQYRQLFATREILALHRSNALRDAEFYNKLLSNTSMSDGRKAAFEMKEDNKFANRLKHQFQQSIVKHFGSFGQQIKQSLANSLRSSLSGVADAFTMGDDALSGIQDAQEMGADISVSDMIARSLGRGTMEKVMQFAARPIRNKLGQNKKVTGFGAKLNYYFQNLPEHITKWARTPTNGDSVFSDLINLFKEMVPRKGLDNSFGESPIYSADEPAQFNMQTRRSIVEVIPGYLARIHHELLKQRNPDAEMVTYNMMRGSFSTVKEAGADAMRQIFNPRKMTQARMGLDEFIDKYIDPDKTLSKPQREALRRQMFSDTVKGELFDPERFLGDNSDMTELMGDDRNAVASVPSTGRATRTTTPSTSTAPTPSSSSCGT